MTTVNIADRWRIAIALAALSYKQSTQTYESYALELQGCFISTENNEATINWRKRALQLEQDLADLKQKYENDQIKLLSFQAESSRNKSLPESSHGPSKKKKKTFQNTSKAQGQPPPEHHAPPKSGIQTILNKLESSSIPQGRGIMTAFDVIQDIYISYTCSPSNHIAAPILLSAFKRACNAVTQAFESHLNPSPEESCRLPVATLSDLVSLLIATVYPVLFTKLDPSLPSSTASPHLDLVDQVTGHLATSLLIPVIRAFPHISSNLYAFYLRKSHQKTNHTALTHLRIDLLELFHKMVTDIRGVFISKPLPNDILSIFSSLLRTLSLEASTTLTGLDDLFPKNNPNHLNHDFLSDRTQPKSRRISSLAARDTAWYLCSILRICTENATINSNTEKQNYSSFPGNSQSSNYLEQERIELREKLLRDQSLASVASVLSRLTPCSFDTAISGHSDPAKTSNAHDDTIADTTQVFSCDIVTADVVRNMILATYESLWVYSI